MDMSDQLAIAQGMQQKAREMHDMGDTMQQWEIDMKKDEKRRLAQNEIEDKLKNNGTSKTRESNNSADSNKYEAHKAEGNKCFQLGNFAEAIILYEKALEETSNAHESCVLYSNRAMCQLKLKQFAAAKQSCNMAIELNEKNEKAWFRLMQACKDLDEAPEALQAGLKVLHLNPKNANAKQIVDELIKKNVRVPIKRAYKSTLDGLGKDVSFIDKPPHLQSRSPMKNILRPKSAKISTRSVPLEATADNNNNKDKKAEIDMDFIEKADNKQLKAVESSTSSTSFRKNTKDVENNTIKLSRPLSSAEFVREWKAKSSSSARFALLKAIPSGDLTKLVDPHLDSAMLAELLQVLSVDFVKDGASPINYLLELAKCRELGILAMMMGTEERKAIAAIVDDEKRRHERSLQTISKAFSL